MNLIKDLALAFDELQPASWNFDPQTGKLTARAKPQTNHQLGFVAQAPIGAGCGVNFEGMNFSYTSLTKLRDGS